MYRIQCLFLSGILLAFSTAFHSDPVPAKASPMTAAEKNLYQKIMAYRKELGLPEIKISPSLNKVAQLHAIELLAEPPEGKCNLHSWTGQFGEKKCCYTDDHREAACMWEKPAQFTSYRATGFEIAAYNTSKTADFLQDWKESPGHHAVIINSENWKKLNWKAIGIGIRHPYAVVWFGTEEDKEKP